MNKKLIKVSFSSVASKSRKFDKYRIKIMHEGLNLNGSNFSFDAIERAKETLANIPLLAFVKKTDGAEQTDFAGHEMEWKVTENGVESIYLGRPIGVVPETNNYDYSLDAETGKMFVSADAYIWKNYANEALNILNRKDEKSVSMEINVLDGKSEPGYYDITTYEYLGICFLGEDVPPAMIGAKAARIEFNHSTFLEKCALFSKELLEEDFSEEAGEYITEDTETEKETSDDDFEVIDTEGEETEADSTIATETEAEADDDFEVTETESKEETVKDPDFSEDAKTDDVPDAPSIETLSARISELEKEVSSLLQENALLSKENDINQIYKAKAFEVLVEQFSDLGEEYLKEFTQKTAALSYEECEMILFAERGKKMAPKFSKGIKFEPNDLKQHQQDNMPIWASLVKG